MKRFSLSSFPSRKRLYHELGRWMMYALCLSVFFCAFSLYRQLILEPGEVTYLQYEYDLLESLFLAKIILIGQFFRLGERFDNRPLIYSTLYKTLVFLCFVFFFLTFEHFLMGFVHDRSLRDSYDKLIQVGLDEILARMLLMSFFFVLFFAFIDLSQVVGKEKLFDIFFRKRGRNGK